MKRILLVLVGWGALVAQGADRSGTYDCKCEGSACGTAYSFSYDRDTLRVAGEGPSWKNSGYAIRQESKTTGDVYLTLPRGAWLPAISIAFLADGRIRSQAMDYECSRRN